LVRLIGETVLTLSLPALNGSNAPGETVEVNERLGADAQVAGNDAAEVASANAEPVGCNFDSSRSR
jgi:hypothetical protein